MELKKMMLVAAALGAVHAQADYYADVSMSQSYDKRADDNSGEPTHQSTDESLAVYFDTISMANGPYAEAAFLSKTGSVEVGERHNGPTRDRDGHDNLNYGRDVTYLKAGYVIPGIDMIVQATHGRVQDDIDAHFSSAGVGAYITDRATLVLEYSRLKNHDYNYPHGQSATINGWMLTYRQLFDFGSDQYLVVEPRVGAGEYYGQDTRDAGISGTWYFTKQLGVRAGFDHSSREEYSDDIKVKEFFAGVDYFWTDDIRTGAVVKKLTSNHDDYDVEHEGAEIYVSLLVK